MSMSVGGIASGFDTSNMVSKMMEVEKRPIYLLEDKKSKIDNDLSAWNSVEGSLDSLESSVSDLGDTFEKMGVNVENEEVVSVNADPNANLDTYNINVKQMAKSHTIASNQQSDDSTDLNLNGTFEVNGNSITVENADSLIDIKDKINSKDTGVNASVIDDRLVLKSEDTGTANEMTLSDDTTTNILGDLGLLDNTGGLGNPIQQAKDSIIDLNGIKDIKRSSNTLDDVVEGMTINLKKEEQTNFEVGRDIDGMVEDIKGLVESYNNNFSKIDSLTAKDGQLQGDISLNNIKFDLRRSVADPIESGSDFNLASFAGIESDRVGNLTLDEGELRNALENNFSEVKDMFLAEKEDTGYSGIKERMNNELNKVLDTYSGTINGIKDQLNSRKEDINEQIDNLEYRMDLKEQSLRDQFMSMETNIGEMQQTKSWLSSQISSLGTGSLLNL